MLQIACFDITSAETALKSMADRIELSQNFELGGITPDYYEFMNLKRNYKTPVYVKIQPKGGSYYYSEDEFTAMKNSLILFREAGADGFVFGVLNAQNEIDESRSAELITLAGSIPCVFNRAIDRTSDLEKSMQTLIKLGFRSVITSGGQNTAMAGKAMLKQLVEQFPHKLEIIIGGGVRSENITELKDFTGGTNFHSSAVLKYDTFASEDEIKKLKKLSLRI